MNASTTACAAAMSSARLIKCRVRARTEAGERHSYTALFNSTCKAVMDALDRFGACKVSAEAVRE